VLSSRDFRSRNLIQTGDYPNNQRGIPPTLLVGCLAILLVLCCGGAGLAAGLVWGGGGLGNVTKVSLPFGQPSPTPTLDKNVPVPLRTSGVMDTGLALTVINVQRPLKVQGGVTLPADQQFILVTVQITNTKRTGTAIRVTSADFNVTGDGGLVYDPNPKTVTIPNLLNEASIAPGKNVEAELIFQIATDDSGLKLSWKAGSQTRVFLLEKQ
jgi:hypothetical protein